MRYALILIPFSFTLLLQTLPQNGQGKKPDLPPLPESEVPAPPGVTPEKATSGPGGKASEVESPASPSGIQKKDGTKDKGGVDRNKVARNKVARKKRGSRQGRPAMSKKQRSLMGVWRVLPSASLGGNTPRSITGYLIITQSHLSFQFLRERNGDQPGSFQVGTRTYAIHGNQIITNSLQGIRNGREAGKLLLDPRGLRETRKFALLAPNVLRLIQPKGQILELQRIEKF